MPTPVLRRRFAEVLKMEGDDRDAAPTLNGAVLRFALAMLAIDCGLLMVSLAMNALGHPTLLASVVRSFEIVGPLLGVAHVMLPLIRDFERQVARSATAEVPASA